jgi:hypothetical protein
MSPITINLGIIWEIPYIINPCLLPRRPYNECDSAQMALEDTIFSNQIQPEVYLILQIISLDSKKVKNCE